jgi:acetyl-CoA carboxylase beta subunit
MTHDPGPRDPHFAAEALALHVAVASITSDREASFSEEPLACPSCGVELTGTNAFETFRVCPGCHRHFPIPARERLRLLVDDESFRETNAALVSLDPLVFRDLLPVPDRLAQAAERFAGPGGGVSEAVLTGRRFCWPWRPRPPAVCPSLPSAPPAAPAPRRGCWD